MKKIFIFVEIFVMIFLLTGCLSDYDIELPNGYEINATSTNQVSINFHGTVLSDNIIDDSIPTKVVQVGYDERYVIAKQYEMKKKYPNNPSNTYEIPDETKVCYWILDTIERKKYGPYNSKEQFDKKLNEFSIGNLQLKELDSYEKKQINKSNYKDIWFGKNVKLVENYDRNVTDAYLITEDGVINFAWNISKYKNIKSESLLYIVMKKELDIKYQYIIVDYKNNDYKVFTTLDELSETDRKIFKESDGFINTIN